MHILTGPIYVCGAEPGDVLQVSQSLRHCGSSQRHSINAASSCSRPADSCGEMDGMIQVSRCDMEALFRWPDGPCKQRMPPGAGRKTCVCMFAALHACCCLCRLTSWTCTPGRTQRQAKRTAAMLLPGGAIRPGYRLRQVRVELGFCGFDVLLMMSECHGCNTPACRRCYCKCLTA